MVRETIAQKIAKLENKVAELTDENESLWRLLEELRDSNVANPEYESLYRDAFQKARYTSLLSPGTVEEA